MGDEVKTFHSIVIVTDRVERSISVATILEQAGYQVSVAQGLYEGLRQIDQHMPHLVLAGSIYYDGTIANLQDRLLENDVLAQTPILAWIPTKTKSQLLPLKDRNFSGFILGKASGTALLSKVNEILEPFGSLSPYLIKPPQIKFEEKLDFSLSSAALGHEDNYLLMESSMVIGMQDKLMAWKPFDQQFKFTLSHGQMIPTRDKQLAIFPFRELRHPVRTWFEGLPSKIRNTEKNVENEIKIGWISLNDSISAAHKKIFAGYGIELDDLASIEDLMNKKDHQLKETYQGIYLDGFVADHPDLLRLCQLQKESYPFPTLLICQEKVQNTAASRGIRYVGKPCQFGELLDQLMMLRFHESSIVPKEALDSFQLQIRDSGRLIGLDENGGVFEFHREIAPQTELLMEHAQLIDLWEGEKRIIVIRSVPKPGCLHNTWYIAFRSNHTFGNKAKYWQRLHTKLESLRELNRSSA
ncbi:MAG: hypothetical protein ACOH5I_11475 [Oligoflexus sp.]